MYDNTYEQIKNTIEQYKFNLVYGIKLWLLTTSDSAISVNSRIVDGYILENTNFIQLYEYNIEQTQNKYTEYNTYWFTCFFGLAE